ncbi:hypothetical protein AJ80_04130 [Polytolypa hystricis UAMH7299]|uniref:C2H2-type domain-containing protein n=1 Tax=Polytolypa hystricis (strain UAMH7299) TaxID=1447883 RepID=A0A2B7Y537_POLH7|nr:hypothetical protein AJ80_04130 [Polytolypa hystricis UAMH7299]
MADTTTHPFTCNTCQVAFRNSDSQRTHMRSDWHRYNLKRRVASLPPLPSDIFAEKVLAAQATNSAAAAKASYENSCDTCQKTYYSENAFQNHIGSQKHKQKVAYMKKMGVNPQDETASVLSGTFSMGEPITVRPAQVSIPEAAVDEEFSSLVDGMKDSSLEAKDPLSKRPSRPTPSTTARRPSSSSQAPTAKELSPLTHCLFCNYNSEDLKLNVRHMRKSHGMFIPEQPYLVDMEGLLKYLYDKITQNNECLYCHKLKNSAAAIQTHMRDKGHCMIAFESEDEMLEVGEFYDFTSTYSDDEEEGEEDDSVVDGAKGEDEGWETDASSIDSDDPRAKVSSVYATDYELHLPSGRTAGHRSLAKYYRQNLHSYPTPEERLERQLAIADSPDAEAEESARRGRDAHNRALISRANGGTGMIGATESQKREVRAADRRGRNQLDRARRDYQWGVNKVGNHQKHFRDHLLQ